MKLMNVMHRHVRFLDVTLLEALLFALYLVLNVCWATIFAKTNWTYASSFGFLASANGLFVVIPASRNSLWAWLFGVPFDKAITIHRWLGDAVARASPCVRLWLSGFCC